MLFSVVLIVCMVFLDLNLVDWGWNKCIAVGLGYSVFVWNHETQATTHLLDLPTTDYVSSVSWQQCGNVVAIASSDTRIQVSSTNKCVVTTNVFMKAK